jgi:hypothetical protein
VSANFASIQTLWMAVGGKLSSACGNRVMMPGRGWSVDPARNHSHATRQAEKVERAVTALKQVEQRNEFAGRAAEREWVGRAKGCFGTHDALLAGLA